ncbi:MAG: hypothetical protein K2X72_31595 [Reyranella sp.]|nr:hypothetical protein [Reyranella sp.]
MKFKDRTLHAIADMICGNPDRDKPNFFEYRSSSYLTGFFMDCDTDYKHDGSTRGAWVAGVLAEILNEPHANATTPPATFARVIDRLMDPADAQGEPQDRPAALAALNLHLGREGFEAFYGPDKKCHLRHIATNTVAAPNPHRPFTPAETERRERLAAYLDKCSEDGLIGEVLLPLFRQLGFTRITEAGHEDKALEYGKDVWMKFTLPTTHGLYFGIQAKKGKLDAAGMTKGSNANVAEVHRQAVMMLGHKVFDPETGRRHLIDHAYIIAGGEITKQARNWIGENLDASTRSKIMFMDRNDILNLFTVTNLPIPGEKA